MIYMLNAQTNQWIEMSNNSYYYTSGQANSDLTLLKELFSDYSSQLIWKIDLGLYLVSLNLTVHSSAMFYVNQPPFGGLCDINPKNGTVYTNFNISCSNWTDTDGQVVNYAFYGNFFRINVQSNVNIN